MYEWENNRRKALKKLSYLLNFRDSNPRQYTREMATEKEEIYRKFTFNYKDFE